MKSGFMTFGRPTFALLLAALPELAAGQTAPGPYVSLGAGVDILQNEIVKPYGFGPTKRDWTFGPGPAGEGSIGYGFGNGLRLELEGDAAYSHLSGVKFPDGEAGEAVGHELQYGGFANLDYDFNVGLPVTPYLGVGAGYQELDLDGIATGPAGFTPRAGLGSESAGAFAYQGIAGLSLPVMAIPGLSFTAEYHLIGVITPPPFPRGTQEGENSSAPLVHGNATLNNIFNHEALIGLRYSFGTPPAPQRTSSVPNPIMPPAPVTRTYLVFFDWDRADLTDRARQIVAEAAAASTHVAATRIDVNGYTDLSGSAAYNQRLSIRRAESVEAELVRDGVPKTEIFIRGFGETNPLVPTAPGVREPQNRRVEIILH